MTLIVLLALLLPAPLPLDAYHGEWLAAPRSGGPPSLNIRVSEGTVSALIPPFKEPIVGKVFAPAPTTNASKDTSAIMFVTAGRTFIIRLTDTKSLVLEMFTELSDGGGRSNYASKITFSRSGT